MCRASPKALGVVPARFVVLQMIKLFGRITVFITDRCRGAVFGIVQPECYLIVAPDQQA